MLQYGLDGLFKECLPTLETEILLSYCFAYDVSSLGILITELTTRSTPKLAQRSIGS